MRRTWMETAAGFAAPAILALLWLLAPIARAATTEAPAERAALEKKLAEARERLDDAARDVAELSGQLYGGHAGERLMFLHGKPRSAMLGINIGDTQTREDGVEVMGVSPGGGAEQAGLRTGDVIVAVNGKPLRKSAERTPSQELVEFMRSVEPGQVVKVEYLRAGKRQSAEVTTSRAEPPIARALRGRMAMPLPEGIELPDFEELLGPARSFRSLELVQMTPGLGRYFGTETGLLVVRVPAASGLELEEGDVLLSIDGRTPETPGHAFRILRSYQPGEKVKLGVLRNRKRVVLDAVIPAAESTNGPGRPRAPSASPMPPPPPPPADAGPA